MKKSSVIIGCLAGIFENQQDKVNMDTQKPPYTIREDSIGQSVKHPNFLKMISKIDTPDLGFVEESVLELYQRRTMELEYPLVRIVKFVGDRHEIFVFRIPFEED